MDVHYPRPLKPGGTIALVAPASPPKRENIERFVTEWQERGYHLQVSENVFERNGYLAGSDSVRARDLMRAFEDPNIDAIFTVRGGYGVNRMVDLLDFDVIRDNPKLFVGFSDITTLHAAINRLCNLVTFHSPHPNDGLDPLCPCKETKQSFLESVCKPIAGRLLCDGAAAKLKTITPGKATGRLAGGNLALLSSIIGTPYAPDLTNKILFLEDAGEQPYRIDRFLSQLKVSGELDKVAGVLLGHFSDCDPANEHLSLSMQDVLDDYLKHLAVPMLAGFPSGHQYPNLTLPMHAVIELDADAKTVRIADEQTS